MGNEQPQIPTYEYLGEQRVLFSDQAIINNHLFGRNGPTLFLVDPTIVQDQKAISEAYYSENPEINKNLDMLICSLSLYDSFNEPSVILSDMNFLIGLLEHQHARGIVAEYFRSVVNWYGQGRVSDVKIEFSLSINNFGKYNDDNISEFHLGVHILNDFLEKELGLHLVIETIDFEPNNIEHKNYILENVGFIPKMPRGKIVSIE